jgi:hypothetical protein
VKNYFFLPAAFFLAGFAAAFFAAAFFLAIELTPYSVPRVMFPPLLPGKIGLSITTSETLAHQP